MTRRAFPVVLSGALAFVLSCRHDPVPQSIIDGLGDEKGTPSATHRPGQPCLACHDKYGGAQPEMAVGGTVYTVDPMTQKLVPAKNVQILIRDSSDNGGTQKKACSNSAGNFFVAKENWQDIVYPLQPVAGGIPMVSLIGRDGSCASCHKHPDHNPDALDKTTGAGRESAGVIIVDPTVTCSSGGGG